MKQLLIFLFTLLYAWAALAEQTRFLRRGKGTRNICVDLGKRTGKQTLEVPKEMVGFFTSRRRTNPAKRGRCPEKEGKKALKTLKKRHTKSQMFCRKIRGKLYTTRGIKAASTWMLENGFEEGRCTERTATPLRLRYVPPETTTTTTTTTEAPKASETTKTPKKESKDTETTDNEAKKEKKPKSKGTDTRETTDTETEEKKPKNQDT